MDEAQDGRVEAQENGSGLDDDNTVTHRGKINVEADFSGNEPLTDERVAAMIERAEHGEEVGIAQIVEPQGEALARAIADHFGISREQITGFVVACEYEHDEQMSLSSAWSIGSPIWRLRAIVAEVAEHLRSM